MQYNITDDLEALLRVLPPRVRQELAKADDQEDLLEIILDLGRPAEARYVDRELTLGGEEVSQEDIDFIVARIGDFGEDNRAGIERTLHRISAIRNRKGRIVGLTMRVGRAISGTIEIIRDIVTSGQSVLLLGRPGVGKCVTGDTLILSSDGLQPLADFVPDRLEVDEFAPIEATVFGLNGLEPASHAYNGGLASTIRVTTRQGFTLEGTPEHPVLALTTSGDLVFRRLDDLRLGDYLAIQRRQQCFGTTTALPPFEFQARTNALDGRVPTELTEDLARFLGYLVAEGTLSFDNQVAFSHTDPEIQADMTALTESLFGLRLRPHLHNGQWNGKDFRVFGVKLRRFLERLGLARGRAADKRIPPCILTAPQPIVTAFLRALFEGDGSVYGPHGRVEIASASRALLSQLHVLLLNYGIVGNLRAKFNTKYQRDYYYLTLIGENVVRFADTIGFLSTRKQAKLAAWAKTVQTAERNPNIDVVPFQNERLRTLRASLGHSSDTFYRFTKADNRAPSYHTLERIVAEAADAAEPDVLTALQDLLEAKFFFDPVKQLDTGEAYVYDLTVPASHSFFANGFVSHNTTMLREVARVLSENRRVVIVDTSNEIGGDGDIPHPAVGRSRRMQVSTPMLQHEVMIEAVENHMPQAIVIDEIGREQEAEAARTIAERGVQLIGTAHGQTLVNLMNNPTLADLVGGIQTVTLSDEEARRRGTQKSVLERMAPPTFDVVVEIQDWEHLTVHPNVAEAVDGILRGKPATAELRYHEEDGEIKIKRTALPPPSRQPRGMSTAPHVDDDEVEDFEAAMAAPRGMIAPRSETTRTIRVHPYGISQNRLRQAAKSLQLPVFLVDSLRDADVLLTLKSYYRKRPQAIVEAEQMGVPVYVLRSNTVAQIESALADVFGLEVRPDPFELAMREAQTAINEILRGSRRMVELKPQNSFIRRQQHEMARLAKLGSQSSGDEPRRRVRIFRSDGR